MKTEIRTWISVFYKIIRYMIENFEIIQKDSYDNREKSSR